MFRFTRASTVHAALLAAALALFAAQSAFAARPADPHVHTQTASRAGTAGDHGVSAQYASRAGDRQNGAGDDS
jgi:hypothetical protein